MVSNSPTSSSSIVQEHPNDAPPGWNEVQSSLADDSGLALLLVDGPQPPAVTVTNNNSICRAFQSSSEHCKRCDPYCGDAHRRALHAGTTIHYKCHAGLECFALPVEIAGNQNYAVIGGRAFVKGADYHSLVERFRTGDLQDLISPELFKNVLFADQSRLPDLAARVQRVARKFKVTEIGEGPASDSEIQEPENKGLELEVERLRSELEYRARFADSLQSFLERISSTDPATTYQSIVSHSTALLQSERASLLVYDENANVLVLKAAIGLAIDPASVSDMRIGEGVSGEVLESGQALMVDDTEALGDKQAPPERLYKTNSFISFPITIGGRK